MDHVEHVERLSEHIREHPKDYQAVIAHLKARSDAYEHVMYLRKIDRLRSVAEIRKKRKALKEDSNGREQT